MDGGSEHGSDKDKNKGLDKDKGLEKEKEKVLSKGLEKAKAKDKGLDAGVGAGAGAGKSALGVGNDTTVTTPNAVMDDDDMTITSGTRKKNKKRKNNQAATPNDPLLSMAAPLPLAGGRNSAVLAAGEEEKDRFVGHLRTHTYVLSATFSHTFSHNSSHHLLLKHTHITSLTPFLTPLFHLFSLPEPNPSPAQEPEQGYPRVTLHQVTLSLTARRSPS